MRKLTGILLLVVVGSLVREGFAQQEGDEVTAKSEAELKVEREVVAKVAPQDVLVVEQVQGEWLWVRTAADQRGWIKADRVAARETPTADSPLPAGTAPSPTDPLPSAEPADPETDRLTLIGALASSHVYTTYAYIGVLADSLSKDLYDVNQVKDLLGETIAIAENLERQLQKVGRGDLSPSDRAAIENMIAIYALLRDEARAVVKFADSRANEDAAEFDRIRTTVWPKIAALLGLDESKGLENSAE